MQFFLFGLLAMVIMILAVRRNASANTLSLARVVRRLGAVLTIAMAIFLLSRGLVLYALLLGMLGTWLFSTSSSSPWDGSDGTDGAAGQVSRIVTDHLEMELDLTSGQMRGRVLSGQLNGHDLAILTPMNLSSLWQDYQFKDPPSAQLLEAYLDRLHPSWRDDMAREGMAGSGQQTGADQHQAETPAAMSRAQASEILGLPSDASIADIHRAHRDLMMKIHPDRGGSTYLAAKINEAKDLLLGRTTS